MIRSVMYVHRSIVIYHNHVHADFTFICTELLEAQYTQVQNYIYSGYRYVLIEPIPTLV